MDDELAQKKAEFELEKKKLELEKERATLQLEIEKQKAETERDKIKATQELERLRKNELLEQMKAQSELITKIVPKPETKPLEGKTDIGESSGYVAELVGYHSLKQASSHITERLGVIEDLADDTRILIVNQLNYAVDDVPLIEVSTQCKLFDTWINAQINTNNKILGEILPISEKYEISELAKERVAMLAAFPLLLPLMGTAISALPAVAGLVGATADIAGYFKTDYVMKGREFSLKDEALIAAVAGSLRSDGRHVYIYNFYSLDISPTHSALVQCFTQLHNNITRFTESRNRLKYFSKMKTEEISELQKQLKKLEKEADPTPATIETIKKILETILNETAWLDRANLAILDSDTIQGELTTFLTSVTSTGNAESISKLAQALLREKVRDLGITHLLYLGVVSSGGESITKKSIWRSGNISYIGGAVVTYVLSSINGDVLSSDTLPILSAFDFDPSGKVRMPLRQIRFGKQQ